MGDSPAAATYSGTSFLVSNFVQGIGLPQFEEWAAWGVGGNLKNVMHFPSIQDFVLGPKLHELAHAWGAYVLEGDESSGWNGHWGFTSANGQLGGFDRDTLRFLGPVGTCPQTFAAARTPILDPANPYFGPNANGGDSLPYGPLELYLMGKLGPEELPVDTIIAPGAYFIDNAFLRFCAPNGLLQYPTRSWLEGRHGVRQPNAFSSNFSHRVLFVQVYDFSRDDPYGDNFLPIDLACEIYDFTLQGPNANSNDYNFWEATFGRGALDAPPATTICPNCNYLNPNPIDPGDLGPSCGQ